MELVLTVIFWASAALLAHTYVVYPIILPLLARLFGREVQSDAGFEPRVAFLVPVYNEERVIKAKIENILALDYPPGRLSIWVGSDQSTDGTEAVVRAFEDPRIHWWVAPQRGGKTQVLNLLAPQVKDADVLVFTDANTMHRRDALRKLVAPLADSAVGGVAGHIEHAVEQGSQYEERAYRSFESGQKRCEALLHSTIGAFGGYYAIRAELFRSIPANAYSNDDVLIPMGVVRQGKRMWFAIDAVATEDNTEDLAQEFKRRIRIGAGNYQSFSWLGAFLNPLRGWPCFCYVSHKVGRWFSPLLLSATVLTALGLSATCQCLMYSVVWVGAAAGALYAVTSRIVPLPMGRPAYYFLAMNIALLFGLGRFARGIRSAAWDRTARK